MVAFALVVGLFWLFIRSMRSESAQIEMAEKRARELEAAYWHARERCDVAAADQIAAELRETAGIDHDEPSRIPALPPHHFIGK